MSMKFCTRPLALVLLVFSLGAVAPVAQARHRTGGCTGACAYPLPT